MMKVCLLFALLSLASATDFKNSIILTSADIPDNVAHRYTQLKSNVVYRIYATYTIAGSDDYAKNVFITDDTGARFTVYGLSLPNANSVYFLDNLRTLRAPITVQDTNVGAHTTPYTIYIVDASYASFPVVSARHANGLIDSNNGFVAAGLSVLSAEPLFTMNGFNMYGLSNMVISSVGFDESSNIYNVLSVSSREASQSFLTMYGPIVTLFNTNWGWNARFSFTLTRAPWNYQLNGPSAFALMSPGYLSNDASYNIPYTTEVEGALQANYQWAGNNYIGYGYCYVLRYTGELQ